MKRDDIQFLAAPVLRKRVETGVVQFGDDWPGIFIRGDDCFGRVLNLRKALELLAKQHRKAEFLTPEDQALSALAGIVQLLESSDVRSIKGYFKTKELVDGLDADAIARQAQEEVQAERQRERINAIKYRLLNKVPFWQKIFPWKFTITRR